MVPFTVPTDSPILDAEMAVRNTQYRDFFPQPSDKCNPTILFRKVDRLRRPRGDGCVGCPV